MKKTHLRMLSFIFAALLLMTSAEPLFAAEIPQATQEPSLSPSEVQTVWVKEHASSSHVHASEIGWIEWHTDYASLQQVISQSNDRFDVDSALPDLPSLAQQLATYDEAFFERHILLIAHFEGYRLSNLPSPGYMTAPELKDIFLEDNAIRVDIRYDWPVKSENIIADSQYEYKMFIAIDREQLKDHPNILQNGTVSLLQNRNPNTADPVLSFTALAVASTALLAAGVSLGRQRRRVH